MAAFGFDKIECDCRLDKCKICSPDIYIPYAKTRVKELEDAMRTFVERVEKGTIRSVKTYTQFKNLLEK